MYESYSWPGAYNFKDEIKHELKHLLKWFKHLLGDIHGEIKETEEKVSSGNIYI